MGAMMRFLFEGIRGWYQRGNRFQHFQSLLSKLKHLVRVLLPWQKIPLVQIFLRTCGLQNYIAIYCRVSCGQFISNPLYSTVGMALTRYMCPLRHFTILVNTFWRFSCKIQTAAAWVMHSWWGRTNDLCRGTIRSFISQVNVFYAVSKIHKS